MSGGVLVWLTDKELELLSEWYHAAAADSGPTLPEDDKLLRKFDAAREEVSCRVGRA